MISLAPIIETNWLQLSSIHDQNMANTMVAPVIEKVTALLACEPLPSRVKKLARPRQVQLNEWFC